MTTITTTHIQLDDQRRPFIDGTGTRVAMIVMDTLNGLTPQQIHNSYPYLSMAQIHSALSYYFDHQSDIDAEISREVLEIQTLRNQALHSQPSRSTLQSRLTSPENRA
ncbi:MAG TPA: DUF433 domain-containing protein [Tepidisphaeraceae bacterium]|jgi:uncharacterized protein (DUF433 family)|nr:DUF433 domain-containing protein [Tepidisphaeraceae bacterium]